MSPREKLHVVPRRIQDWFWSDDMDQVILEIEGKFGLPEDETVLPRLLFDVEVRDLPLEKLQEELTTRLNLPPAVGRELYEEVKSRVFIPLARDFLAFGIGETELAGAVPPEKPAAMPSVPPAGPLGAAMPPPAPAPALAALPDAPAPVPVSLYRDTLASQATVGTPRLGVRDTGDISGTVASAPVAQRAARIDLGVPAPSPRKEAEFKSIFVERETPLPQKIDYGVPPPASPVPDAPVPLAGAPAPVLDRNAPFISPNIEVVTPQAAAMPATEEPPRGFLSSFMHRVAPWHAKKFAKVEVNEPLLPAATINYTDVPTAPAPDAPAAPVPVPDAPAPPRP